MSYHGQVTDCYQIITIRATELTKARHQPDGRIRFDLRNGDGLLLDRAAIRRMAEVLELREAEEARSRAVVAEDRTLAGVTVEARRIAREAGR